jgi:hypothetical protein
MYRTIPAATLWLLMASATPASAEEPKFPPFTPGASDATFAESSKHSAADDLKNRLHVKEPIPEYDVKNEKFRVVVPKEYTHDTPWGLVVWIGSGDGATLPAGWEEKLAAHKLLMVSAYKGGNARNAHDRVRLAVDGNHNMRQRFNVDPARVYVGGYSGGGRIASMVAVSHADLFSGGFFGGGVNYYRDVPGDPGKRFPGLYAPAREPLALAKKISRLVLLTSEKDSNRLAVTSTFKNGFCAAATTIQAKITGAAGFAAIAAGAAGVLTVYYLPTV